MMKEKLVMLATVLCGAAWCALVVAVALCVSSPVRVSAADFTVWATPAATSGSNGVCPGKYVGYANYINTNAANGWFKWSTNSTTHTATDTNRTDTHITYVGRFGTDTGCSSNSISVPHPPSNPSYRFTVFFPTNLPAGPYPLVLHGFDQ